MPAKNVRHWWVIGGVLVIALLTATMSVGEEWSTKIVLALAVCVFAYIVFRLSQALIGADRARRRHARLLLVVAAAVPVLALTPRAIGASPEWTSTILLGAAIWMALTMAGTSYLLARPPHGHVRRVTRAHHATPATDRTISRRTVPGIREHRSHAGIA